MLFKLNDTLKFLESEGIANPDVGIVLGTGLGNLIHHIDIIKSIDYVSIPNFPLSTVEFHKGKLVYGWLKNKKVVLMQGRFHYYEGYSFQDIAFPIIVLKLLGIKRLVLSNAAGGINLNYKKGDLVAISDHINLLPGNPLIGKNSDELGSRFPDMSEPYCSTMKQLYQEACKNQSVKYLEGVYAAVTGPHLETRAEYKFLKIIGADLVGMSTVPEVIVANHMMLPCLAVSVVTDECDPENLKPIDISEIIEVAGKADIRLSNLFIELIEKLNVS